MALSLKQVLLGVLAAMLGSLVVYAYYASAAAFPDPRTGAPIIASSTAYALTWGATATRIVATTTGPGTRVGLTVQPVNCSPGGVVYLQHNDVVAATSTGMAVFATTTATYSDGIPIAFGSIRAMAAVASCTLLVTEWRTSM